MLAESVEIIRALWSGGNHTHRGRYIQVEDARLYTLPDQSPDVVVAAGGPQATALAARIGDGAMFVEPNAELVGRFTSAAGAGKPVYGQAPVCWAADEARARQTAHDRWRFALSGWRVQAELPNVANFEAEAARARDDDVAEVVTCGPDPQRFADALLKWTDAGFTHVGVVQAGDEQEGFLRFWQEEVRPRLGS
jgi:G6PDH family F420-dependent oxidoreductase